MIRCSFGTGASVVTVLRTPDSIIVTRGANQAEFTGPKKELDELAYSLGTEIEPFAHVIELLSHPDYEQLVNQTEIVYDDATPAV